VGPLVFPGRRVTHRIDQLFELGERGVVDSRRGRARRKTLERRSHRIDLEEIFRRNLADLRATERRADHETEQFEVAQRLTDRP